MSRQTKYLNALALACALSLPLFVQAHEGHDDAPPPAVRGDAPQRLPDGSWRLARETRWISIPWLRAHLDPARGPWVESALVVNLTGRPRP